MISEKFDEYRHSGNFDLQGPLVTLLATAIASVPLGYAYAYLINWIPFIYLNVLLTFGLGWGAGALTGRLLKMGNVRNNRVAGFCGFFAGAAALYFAWVGHIHSLYTECPWFLFPDQIFRAMQELYVKGSWSLHSGGEVTDIALAVVWAIEAGIILFVSVRVSYSAIAGTPFCEQSRAWLDEERKVDTIAAFEDPAQLAAFREGDLGPLAAATPRKAASLNFTRLTMKHSQRCEDFCTIKLAGVVLSLNDEGKFTEKLRNLTPELVLPKVMVAMVTRFENFAEEAAAAGQPKSTGIDGGVPLDAGLRE